MNLPRRIIVFLKCPQKFEIGQNHPIIMGIFFNKKVMRVMFVAKGGAFRQKCGDIIYTNNPFKNFI